MFPLKKEWQELITICNNLPDTFMAASGMDIRLQIFCLPDYIIHSFNYYQIEDYNL